MAYSPTYTSLIAEIPDICEDSNPQFVGNIPNFLNRAQDQVQRDLALEQWRTYYNDPNVSAQNYLRQNTWLEIRMIEVVPGGGTGGMPAYGRFVLQKRHNEWVRNVNSANIAFGTLPKYWSEDSIHYDPTNSWIDIGPMYTGVSPAPPVFSMNFSVFTRFAPLSPTNQQNWVTLNAGDLLLYAALKQAHIYLINPESAQMMEALYQATLQSAQTELLGLERSGFKPIRSAPTPDVRGGAGV